MQPIADIIPLVDEFAAGKSRGVPIPCWGKIAAKVVLSRLVRSYAWRRKFGLFRHSYTDRKGRGKPDHVARCLARHRAFGSASRRSVVELGPGDTNRLRHSDIRRFRARGFEAGVPQLTRWNALPTPRHRLARPFRELDEEELLIATFHLCACKPTDVVGDDGVS